MYALILLTAIGAHDEALFQKHLATQRYKRLQRTQAAVAKRIQLRNQRSRKYVISRHQTAGLLRATSIPNPLPVYYDFRPWRRYYPPLAREVFIDGAWYPR